jgi:hypothetical protein
MTRYLLSVHTSAGETPSQMSEDETRRGFERIAQLESEMEAAGALVVSARLDGSDTASVIRATNGKVVTTDGPFIESKEVLGGFYIIEAPSDQHAREWAARTSAAINMPIEVRPFVGMRAT